MTEHRGIINIGDTDLNADWIKTKENRKSEAAIHQRIEVEHKKKRKKK